MILLPLNLLPVLGWMIWGKPVRCYFDDKIANMYFCRKTYATNMLILEYNSVAIHLISSSKLFFMGLTILISYGMTFHTGCLRRPTYCLYWFGYFPPLLLIGWGWETEWDLKNTKLKKMIINWCLLWKKTASRCLLQ